MIEVAEAVERILDRIEPLSGESVATGDAAGRVLSDDVIAPLTSPPWDNASMDGYAVRSEDLSTGATLEVVDVVPAGSVPSRGVGPGEAIRIMTGAPVPPGADSVVRHEDTDNGRDKVLIRDIRDACRNIRRAGEDFLEESTLFDRGEFLSVPHLGVLAAAGLRRVQVHRRPRVAIISSGDELIALDEFEPGKNAGKIVSSNSVTLPAAVLEAGGVPSDFGIASDDADSLCARFGSARGSDLIVTTAGISAGDHDHVREAFAAAGGVTEFWKVRMRPGAPIAFGHLDGVPWIGLSGNPVSALVTFELFVRPAIRRMLGARDLFRATVAVRLAESVKLAAPLMHFLRAVITLDEEGHYTARLARSQSSAVLTALARSNALVILSGDKLEVQEGEMHRALPFGPGSLSSRELRLA